LALGEDGDDGEDDDDDAVLAAVEGLLVETCSCVVEVEVDVKGAV